MFKVMESLAALAMKKRGENSAGPWGFLKENLEEVAEDSTKLVGSFFF